ncbi:hypothetical protein KHC23_17895 [Ancylobacter dichloromethanicus]|nr:hypothetical protein [Ancylobacter dichloromethanicus]
MSVAPVRLHDHAPDRSPPDGRGMAVAVGHGQAHPPGHEHDHAGAAPRGAAGHAGVSRRPHGHRHHAHAAGERHPPARPGFSLLRLSALQRLAIALPLAALLWAMALAVIGAGA